jgi:hypothetical protein
MSLQHFGEHLARMKGQTDDKNFALKASRENNSFAAFGKPRHSIMDGAVTSL